MTPNPCDYLVFGATSGDRVSTRGSYEKLCTTARGGIPRQRILHRGKGLSGTVDGLPWRGQLVDIHLIDQKMAPKDRVVDIPATNVEEVTAINRLVGAKLRSDGVGPGTVR